ncbi:hypothetical protein P9239_08030 [Caballeronia sp. LZ062]|uniref:hypothetical protein n=1 Tax=unclassified Caballeronia TaxID=2646786 RepID=UPI0028639060|nr:MULTISPECIES: hypothetical protein [unclassified Caballeronia]MDR5855166.1 hypothetical protein [Caballeronia sp. LZ050]MDR5870304.1 hypothetical protein [Caballeronia sp. LZ062]
MKHELRAALMPLLIAALGPCALAASSVAHAGNFADAAISKQQAGGGVPAEMDLLGSPDTYADPYGAPTNGRAGQRGPITNAQTAQGISPTDRLLAQQNGYVGNPGAGAQLRRVARNDDAKAMLMPQGAAATLYPTPNGFKAPAKAARARDIYKSPY